MERKWVPDAFVSDAAPRCNHSAAMTTKGQRAILIAFREPTSAPLLKNRMFTNNYRKQLGIYPIELLV